MAYQLSPAPGPGVQVEDEVLNALVKARDAIMLPENWCHGEGGFGTPRACIAVAIQRAIGGEGYRYEAAEGPKRRLAYKTFLEANGIPSSDDGKCDLEGWVSEWNDAPGRQHSEVLAAFDRAIASRREKRNG